MSEKLLSLFIEDLQIRIKKVEENVNKIMKSIPTLPGDNEDNEDNEEIRSRIIDRIFQLELAINWSTQ